MASSTSPMQELKKGPWKPEEDMILIEYVKKHGERDWNMVRKHSGLARCGKSCRLRWNNHLRPNLRKGPFSAEEEKLICELHSKIGNKWAQIATMLPGRTDNEIKNFWNTRIKRLARKGAPLYHADIQCPRQDLLNPYLQHLDVQNNLSSSSQPASTSSSSTLYTNLQTQLSPTTPTSHSLLFPPPSSSSQPQFCHYDDVLQNSMALYDAALENSRQQQQQEMIASFQRFKRHRSVPNLTISVPPVRHVALHPFSPLGFSTSSSPLGRSVSMASSPTTTSYMHFTPSPSPHSYASSPTGMVVSPTALQLGIPTTTSQPSFRLPPLSYPPVMNIRPTCLPRTSSFSFDPMMFDLNPTMTSLVQHQTQTHVIDATDNDLAFSIEDLGISMDPDPTSASTILPTQSSAQVNDMKLTVNDAAGPLDYFLKEAETKPIRYDETEFDTDKATAFLNELESDWTESRLNQAESGLDRELGLHEDLSNLLGSTEQPHSLWDGSYDGLVSKNGASHPQPSHQYQVRLLTMLGLARRRIACKVSSSSSVFGRVRGAGVCNPGSLAEKEIINRSRGCGSIRTLSHLVTSGQPVHVKPMREIFAIQSLDTTLKSWSRTFSSDNGDVVDAVVPYMGESITDGTLAKFLKNVGDRVAVDEPIAQVETDKVTIDVASPEAGVIVKFVAKEGDTVEPGAKVAVISKSGEGVTAHVAPSQTPSSPTPTEKVSDEKPKPKVEAAPVEKKPQAPSPPPPPKRSASEPQLPPKDRERRIPMPRLRKRVATRLKDSQNTFAMLTTFNEVDMTNLMKLRSEYKDAFLEKHGVKLGLMSGFVKAAVSGLKNQPIINAVIDGDDIIYRDYIDISVAVGTPKGLVVPVIRGADTMNFAEIEKTINSLAKKASNGTISIDEMAGGTFTISNGGVYGSLLSTPIINPPQSAILGMHSIVSRPMVVGGEVVARPMMYLALTYDHRLIDGREAVFFLRRIKDVVEDPRRLLLDI
ncbi:unnamed protein product [Rhodiola kirilowii]